MRKMRVFAAVLAWSLLIWAAGWAHGATVTILNTGDIHEHTVKLARVAQYVKMRKRRDRNVLFVDAGDRFNRGDLAMLVTRGAGIFDIMSACGYDAAALGNHECSFGTARLAALIGRSKHPILGANLTWPVGMKPANFAPYKIFRLDGVNVGIIGCSAEHFNHRTDDKLKVKNITSAIRGLVPVVRRQADIVVLVTHVGNARDYEIARAVPGLDLIVSGHSHSAYHEMHFDEESQTVIQKAGDHGRFVGEVVFEWDGRKIVRRHARLVKIPREMPEDPATFSVRQKYFHALRPDEPFGRVLVDMTGDMLPAWLAGTVREETRADVVLLLKKPADDMALPAGDLTPRALLAAVPRRAVVLFSVASNRLSKIIGQVTSRRPHFICTEGASPAKQKLLIAWVGPAYDVPFYPERKQSVLKGLGVGEFTRVQDKSLWQMALDSVRRRKAIRPLQHARALR